MGDSRIDDLSDSGAEQVVATPPRAEQKDVGRSQNGNSKVRWAGETGAVPTEIETPEESKQEVETQAAEGETPAKPGTEEPEKPCKPPRGGRGGGGLKRPAASRGDLNAKDQDPSSPKKPKVPKAKTAPKASSKEKAAPKAKGKAAPKAKVPRLNSAFDVVYICELFYMNLCSRQIA